MTSMQLRVPGVAFYRVGGCCFDTDTLIFSQNIANFVPNLPKNRASKFIEMSRYRWVLQKGIFYVNNIVRHRIFDAQTRISVTKISRFSTQNLTKINFLYQNCLGIFPETLHDPCLL